MYNEPLIDQLDIIDEILKDECNDECKDISGYITVLGVDGVIHCASNSNTEFSACSKHMPTKRVNPDFNKLTDIVWCYECSALLEDN